MRRTVAIAIGVLGLGWMIPAHSQGVAFNIGGGISAPLNPTAAYTGIGGNFDFGVGYALNKKNSITGEFLWSGMPPDNSTVHSANAPFGTISLYSLTANYNHHIDSIGGSPFGAYFIMGGGWYYRYAKINKDYVVPPNTVCQPIYGWWGYGCDPSGYVYTQTLASRGVSAPGVNGGVGFTVRLSDTGFRFYMEARYHYAFTDRIAATTLIPVTFGLRYN
jgi:hypothetical protein